MVFFWKYYLTLQQSMDKSKKFDEISVMHVLAMTMIVAFHSMCFYNGRWSKVHAIYIPFWAKLSTFLDVIDLNMFVFISGYLYGYLYIYRNKYRHPSEVIRNKAIRLLIPYCFWGVFMVMSFPWNNWMKLLYGVGHLWFLLMLFGVFTLTVLLQLLNNQRVRFTWKVGLVLIVLGYGSYIIFSKYINPHDFLCASRVLYYFPAFMIGYVCAKIRVAWWLPNWSHMLLPFIVLTLFLLVWYRIPLPSSHILLLRTVCAYAICVVLLIILSKVTMSDRLRQVVQEVERLSMGLYIFNQIAMDLVFTTPVLHSWFKVHWGIGPFLLFLIGFFPPMLMSWVFNRYKILRWTIGG
jgi:surface polysaccharide O-acyltransferase-like enzyme